MTPWALRLLVANVAVFLLVPRGSELFNLLAFAPTHVLLQPWSPVTYMFLHGGFMHLLFNMLALFFFGPRVEARIGSRGFITLYLAAGIAGAALSYIFLFLTGPTSIVGASGAVFGVLYAFAHFWPHERIYIWGILPVPSRIMVIGVAVLSIYSAFTGAGAGIAHFAHLGGFAGGWLYLMYRRRKSKSFQRRATPGQQQSTVDRISGKAARDEKQWDSIPVERLHEINRQEVERIREKIRDRGSGSLTPEERAFMNRMVD